MYLEDLKTYSLLSSLNHPHKSIIFYNFFLFISFGFKNSNDKIKNRCFILFVQKMMFCHIFPHNWKSQSYCFIVLPFLPVWNFLVIPGGRTRNILKLIYWIQHKIMNIMSHIQVDRRLQWIQGRFELSGLCCVGARRNSLIDLLTGQPGSSLDLSPSV